MVVLDIKSCDIRIYDKFLPFATAKGKKCCVEQQLRLCHDRMNKQSGIPFFGLSDREILHMWIRTGSRPWSSANFCFSRSIGKK